MESDRQPSSRLISTFILKVVVDFSESPPNPMLVVSLSVKNTNKKFKNLFFRVVSFASLDDDVHSCSISGKVLHQYAC